jgi:peroxiredoxin
MRLIPALMLLVATTVVEAGSQRLAQQIQEEYDRAMQRWATQLRVAGTPEEQLRVWEQRPDADDYGARVWMELRDSLRQPWVLPHAGWLLETAPVFASEKRGAVTNLTPEAEIIRALDLIHFRNPGAGRLCLSLTLMTNPATLAVVQKVQNENPDEKEQGQAAMAHALLLRHLGDDPKVMGQRLTQLRTAIIKAADVKVSDVTVAKLAEDELYAIRNLSWGSVAPDIAGRDAAGIPFKLSDYRGKVVVLVFWSSGMRDARKSVDLIKEMQAGVTGKDVEVIGVSSDQLQVLRQLKANGTIAWRNFSDEDSAITNSYRAQKRPLVYVLDREGVIQFIGAPGTFVALAVEALLAGP